MKILKFGGTSVGSPERIRSVGELVTSDAERKIVVLSAMAKTTNSLIEISDSLYSGDREEANRLIDRLHRLYRGHVDGLHDDPQWRQTTRVAIDSQFDYLPSFTKDVFTPHEERAVVAQGELLSTRIFVNLLRERGVNVAMLPALDFMRIDANGEPDAEFIRRRLAESIEKAGMADIYVTQGFICRNSYGEVDNLKRGGSDYTASLIGAAADADEIQIWTDIDGMHNNDPRVVDGTRPVRALHFDEAAELAYFGAKILHPTCIHPAKAANIPVRLLNTMQPDAPGTLITNKTVEREIKAVAAKDGITAIRIKSSRMLLAYGFLRKVFEIFESYNTAIDMICTSEVGVSVTIDDTTHLQAITDDLRQYGTVSVDRDMCIICVVGNMDWTKTGFEAAALDAMRQIPTRMISFGGSDYNISFLIRAEDKAEALVSLSKHLFNN